MDAFFAWLQTLSTPEHASEWINGATGALGAIFGGLVSVICTAWLTRRTRRRERQEKLAAGAFAAYQRLNQIYSVASTVRCHFEEGKAHAQACKQPLCTTTMPLARMSGPVVFSIDELWTLLQAGGQALLNRVNSLDHAFNSLLNGVEIYSETWQKLSSELPIPITMQGIVGTLELTPEQLRKIGPTLAQLDHLIEQLAANAHRLVLDAFEALKLLVKAKAKPLGKNFAIVLPSPTGEEVTLRASDQT